MWLSVGATGLSGWKRGGLSGMGLPSNEVAVHLRKSLPELAGEEVHKKYVTY
jgi:hypothetical protein